MTPLLNIDLEENKKIYFASDFHLGLPGKSRSDEIEREKKIIRWLDSVENDAEAIFLVGDIFDFWLTIITLISSLFTGIVKTLSSRQ